MPNIQSAKKRIKSDAKKRLRNKARKSAVATYEKSFEKALVAGDVAAAEALLPTVISQYDKAVKSNVVSKAKLIVRNPVSLLNSMLLKLKFKN